MAEKVVVGMSGGVDSSVAACLLKEKGYEVIGVTLRLWDGEETDRECCSLSAVEDAAHVCRILGIPHYTFNFKEAFREHVVDYFTEEYLHGRTPNPCVMCNSYLKWGAMLQRAKELGADHIATGHYARITRLENGRYCIANSATAAKDQTYVLCQLTQEQLAHTLMPVGDYEKEEVRRMAAERGLITAAKPDSQDICFIPDGDYSAFLERACRQDPTKKLPPAGNFVTTDGRILGQHQGITHYTIGQRRGLGLAMGHHVFVTQIRPETNEVVIGEGEDVFSAELTADRINYMAVPDVRDGDRFLTKIRYAHKGTMAQVFHEGEDRLRFVFEEPVRAVTPGQIVCFYDDAGHVAGGGSIL